MLISLAACGGDDSPDAAEQLQQRAQDGLLASYSATYAIAGAEGADGGQVSVWRTPTTLRLDVRTDAGTSTSITTPQESVACQVPSNGKRPTCLRVAGPGQTPPEAFDPVLRKVFGDALRVLANDDNGLTITSATATPTPGATAPTAAVTEDVDCFAVTAPSDQQKIASGTYCLTTDGIPVAMSFPSGDVTATELTRATPEPSTFVPTTSPTPLPTRS